MKWSEHSNCILLLEFETHSTNYRATPPTPLSRRAALNQDLAPNVFGSNLLRSTDFWLIFGILSLCAILPLFTLIILMQQEFSVWDRSNVYVRPTGLK